MVNDTVLPNIIRFTTTVSHDAGSYGSAYDVKMNDGSYKFDVFFGDQMTGPAIGSPGFQIIADKIMVWTLNSLGRFLKFIFAVSDQV